MTVRLSKVAREFNVGLSTIVEFLQDKGIKISNDPNAKLSDEQYNLVAKEYSKDSEAKKEAKRVDLKTSRQKKETVTIDNINSAPEEKKEPDDLSPEKIQQWNQRVARATTQAMNGLNTTLAQYEKNVPHTTTNVANAQGTDAYKIAMQKMQQMIILEIQKRQNGMVA